MRRLDRITAGIVLALVLVIVLGTSGLTYMEDMTPGPRFVPLWIAVVGTLLAGLLLWQTFQRGARDQPVDWPDQAGIARVAATFVAVVAFAALGSAVGFLLGAALFVAGILILVLRRPVLPSLVTTVLTAGLIQAIFVVWLRLPLPVGFFGI